MVTDDVAVWGLLHLPAAALVQGAVGTAVGVVAVLAARPPRFLLAILPSSWLRMRASAVLPQLRGAIVAINFTFM